MKYENEICQGCGKAFENGDDIVVCPECATPQHRSCYEKNHCCVNSHLHESGFEWKSTNEKSNDKKENIESEIVCPVCQTQNPSSNTFCSNCSFPLPKINEQKQQAEPLKEIRTDEDGAPLLDDVIEQRVSVIAPGITDAQRKEKLCKHSIDLTVSLIGQNAKAYVDKFRKIEAFNKSSFNWAGFFFGPIWLFYRKMYKSGFLFLCINIILSIISVPISSNFYSKWSFITPENIPTLTESQLAQMTADMAPLYLIFAAFILFNLIIGLIGTKLYWKHCCKSLDELDEIRKTKDNMTSLRFYLRNSSVSIFAAVMSYTISSFLPQLLLSLF